MMSQGVPVIEEQKVEVTHRFDGIRDQVTAREPDTETSVIGALYCMVVRTD